MKFPNLSLRGTLICLFISALFSCNKDEEAAQPSEKYYSDLKGIVFGYLSNIESVSVKIEKGNFVKETKSDEKGQYTFDSLETGTYNLTFEREGFGTNKVFGVRHFGFPSDTLVKVYTTLYRKAKSSVAKTGLVYHEEVEIYYNYLHFELEIPNHQSVEEKVIAFVSRKPDVSKDSYEFYLIKEYGAFRVNGDYEKTYNGISVPYNQIAKNGHKNGENLYFKFYTINRNDNGYNDYELKRRVFPTISSSQVEAKEHILSL